MLKKRSVLLSGHATSVALEPEFWAVLDEMATAEGLSIPGLIARVDANRGRNLLASALRLAVLAHLRQSQLTTMPVSGGAIGG